LVSPCGVADVNMPKMFTYADLFAGAGGLGEGFLRTGFDPVAHVEMDEDACFTLKTRIAYHYLKNHNQFKSYVSYLKKQITRDALYKLLPEGHLDSVINKRISGHTLKGIFEKIDGLLNDRKLDVIVGGPPCQAYSAMGRAADEHRMRRDPRNLLYEKYGRFLERYNPKVFVFENVPGLYTAGKGKYHKEMVRYFQDDLGYIVKDEVLDAADFGVVQRRKRVIVIGWKKELAFSYPQFQKLQDGWTAGDIFKDLPHLKAGEGKDTSDYAGRRAGYVNKFEIRNGIDFVTQHITRPHNEKDLKIYALAIDKLEKEGVKIKNNQIPEEFRTQSNITSFLDRFKVVGRDAVSHTMIAHIAKDGHHYIHPDKKQLRSISVREAARIQSFPDDYFFEGSRTSAFRQIGNAVPPLMAACIAQKMRALL